MKKFIIVVLTGCIILYMCACGTKQSQEEALYEKYKGVIDSLETEDYDGAISAIEDLRPAPIKQPSHEVQINVENWQDYFEMVERPLEDGSGNFCCIYLILLPKESESSLIDYSTPFSIEVETFCDNTQQSIYDYDSETHSLILHDPSPVMANLSWNTTVTNEDLLNYHDDEFIDGTKLENPIVPIGEVAAQNYGDLEGTVFKGTGTITNIEGSIYIYD